MNLKKEHIHDFFKKPSGLLAIGLCVYVYALGIMSLFQFVILPHIEPTTKDGLIGGDPQYYHQLATELTRRILTRGWGSWNLRPDGQGNVGIIAILYALIVPKPWIIIPLNALLHSFASVFLISICRQFFSLKQAIISSLFFIISPYQMHWFSQPNKDSFAVAGSFALIYGWMVVLKEVGKKKQKEYWQGLLLIFLGMLIISIVRPYLVSILNGLNLLIISGLIISLFLSKIRHSTLSGRSVILRSAFLVGLWIFLLPFSSGASSDATIRSMEEQIGTFSYFTWKTSKWIPETVEKRLYAIAKHRQFIYKGVESHSNPTTHKMLVDDKRPIKNAVDFLKYFPRALQIALFSPFPKDWIVFHTAGPRSVFRISTTIEMFIAYVTFVALGFGLVINIWNPALIVPTIYSCIVMTIYSYAVPHIGVLYRYRYPFFVLLITLGFSFTLNLFLNRQLRI